LCFCIIVTLYLNIGCDVKPRSSSENKDTSDEKTMLYTTGFVVTTGDGYTKVEVKYPWNSERIIILQSSIKSIIFVRIVIK